MDTLTLTPPTINSGITFAPLEVADDFNFDAPVDVDTYEPTEDDWAALRESDEHDQAPPIESWLQEQASHHRSVETEADRWLAGVLDRLASLARFTGAKTGEDLDARVSTLDLDRAYRIEPSRSGDRYYPGWDLRDADGRLVAYHAELAPAQAELEAIRSIQSVF